MKNLLSFISLAVFVACHSHGNLQQVKRQDGPCPCDTANSQCPAGRLDEGSVCDISGEGTRKSSGLFDLRSKEIASVPGSHGLKITNFPPSRHFQIPKQPTNDP